MSEAWNSFMAVTLYFYWWPFTVYLALVTALDDVLVAHEFFPRNIFRNAVMCRSARFSRHPDKVRVIAIRDRWAC